MQSLRIRIKASDFKEVERKDELTYIRWDATPETVTIPARKKGGEEKTKETGYVVCSELCVRGTVNPGEVDEVITKDLALRYPDGGAPEVNIKL